jgi:hypothetical protein
MKPQIDANGRTVLDLKQVLRSSVLPFFRSDYIIKGINTAGQALHQTPDGVFRGKPRGMKPFFDLTRSVKA